MINAFRIELSNTAEAYRAEQQGGPSRSPPFVGATKFGANSSDMASIILQRQYNETFGMRNMALRQPEFEAKTESVRPDPCRRFNQILDGLGQRMNQCRKAVLSFPGNKSVNFFNLFYKKIYFSSLLVINYLFATNETNRLVFLLTTRSSTIDLTINGLISLVEHSLIEDKYGVVQSDLPTIIRALLQMQTCLEQVIISFNVQSTSKPRMRCSALLCTVKRSLGKLATNFGEFLPDLLSDPKEMHTMNVYAHLRQT